MTSPVDRNKPTTIPTAAAAPPRRHLPVWRPSAPPPPPVALEVVAKTREAARPGAAQDVVAAALKAARSHVGALEQLRPTGEPWEGFRAFRIADVILEADKQRSFVLEPVDGGLIAGFKAGQYLMFKVELDGEEHVRCYSLSDAPVAGRYQVTIKQAVAPEPGAPAGKVSSYFHGLERGAVVQVSAPKGQFVFDLDDPTPAVLLAGGVGVTPLLSMLKEVARSGSERQVHLYYAVRQSSELVRPAELKALAAEHPNIHVHLVVGKPSPGDVRGVDYDHDGYLSLDLLKASLPKQRYEFFMCGPPGMMSALTLALQSSGVPQRHIHTEAFAAPAAKQVAPSAREAGCGVGAKARTVDVVFARTGKSLTWNPEDGSLLDVAQKAGIKMAAGCRQGTCGMCCVGLDDGSVSYPEVDHLEVGEKKILPCIAQAEGRIVVDA